MFRQDAWGVQLSRQEFSEYDVASVLKRFFRDLPEPVLTSKLHPLLCKTSCKYHFSSILDYEASRNSETLCITLFFFIHM